MRKSIIVVRSCATLPPTARFCPIATACCRAFAAQSEGLANGSRRGPTSGRSRTMTLHITRPARVLTLAAAISALAAPAASAIPIEDFKPGERVNRTDRAVPVRVVQLEADQGFDWGDAGLGATGLLAVMTIGAGAAIAGGYRLGRNTPHPAG